MLYSSLCLLGLCTWQCAVGNAWLQQEPLQLETLTNNKSLNLTHDLFGFHKSITEIESITYNEKELGEWLIANLESQGYQTEKQYVDKEAGRFNILAHFGERDAKVVVSSHYDTVPPFLPYKRFSNGTIFGRGSVDDKASLAAELIAINNLITTKRISPESISILLVVGEEVGGDGMRAANSLDLKPQAVIFGEPTERKLVSGHKGNMGFKIHAKGRAAHSGYPWLGRSANEVLTKSLAALMELAPRLPRSEKYGATTVNLGKIEGGVAANVVAESAQANIAVRLAGGTPEEAKKMITKAIHLAVESFLERDMIPEDVVELEWSSRGYPPVDIDHDIPGFDSMTVNYGTDVPNFEQKVDGQKRYLYGPGTIFVAHSDHEALTEEELEAAVEGYERIILYALGKEVDA